MLDADHVFVAGGGDEDISGGQHVFQQHHFKPVHGSLKRTDRVYFSDFYTCARTSQRSSRAFADVTIPHDDGYFTRHHGVCCPTDTVDQRFLAAILIVKLRLSDRVVHVDRRERQLTLLDQFIQAMHASRCFFGNAFDLVAHFGEPTGGCFHPLLDLRLDSDFFFGCGHRNHIFARFRARTQQYV